MAAKKNAPTGIWLAASELLGRPVSTSEPYPCICGAKLANGRVARPVRKADDGTWRGDCSAANHTGASVTPPPAPEMAADDFAKLLASVAASERIDPTKPMCPACGLQTSPCQCGTQEPMTFEPEPDSEDLATAVKRICRSYSESSARSQQVMIGLSEIGDPCDRAVAYKLFEMPAVNTSRDSHLADVGTAWHVWLAGAYEAENQRLGRVRYLIEERVFLTDGYSGTCDLFDVDTGRVCDHKLLGVTSLQAIRNGDIPEKYRVQLHSYGYGHARAGRNVREVALICYPRSDNLGGDFSGKGLHVHVEPYDERIALQGLDRLGRLSALLHQLDPEQNPDRWSLIPATPSKGCRHCPSFRPSGGPADASGCPGAPVDVPTTMPGIL
jgi:hypothetical protein